jgi:IS1 family transposase
MNKLSAAKRAQILAVLVDGGSVSAAHRITKCSKVTILRLLEAVGPVCVDYQRQTLVNLPTLRVQADEQWSFIFSKEKNTAPEYKETGERGDSWTWVALDADTKLVISWLVGPRTRESAFAFMGDLASRLANRVQLTTDALNQYLAAVEESFGWNGCDYARLLKVFGASTVALGRYSPARLVRCEKQDVMGKPDDKHVSTSFIERQNLNTRMNVRRFTRLTNAFSKKLANHKHAVALHFFHHNFCRKHATLTANAGGIHTTPAMACGLTDHVWQLEELVSLIDAASTK